MITPGFVDCHTHVVFGGSRVAEYAIKLTDDGRRLWKIRHPHWYLRIGQHDRDVPVEVLAARAERRMRNMLITGTTTIESKSGYGLTLPLK